jgi:hypothetical protein
MLDRGHPVAPGVGLLPEHHTGVGGRPGSALRRENHPRSQPVLFVVMVQGM